MDQKMNRKELGNKGETVANVFLMKHGFRVIQRNYLKKCGEIDIIALKDKKLHFVEVKSVTRVAGAQSRCYRTNFRPEDNVHSQKIARMKRTIQIYLAEHHIDPDLEFACDIACVYLDIEKRVGKVRMIWDVIL